ncbi:hypothetical protein BDW71DRAFT_38505 [Aspergillus fruticulosus]
MAADEKSDVRTNERDMVSRDVDACRSSKLQAAGRPSTCMALPNVFRCCCSVALGADGWKRRRSRTECECERLESFAGTRCHVPTWISAGTALQRCRHRCRTLILALSSFNPNTVILLKSRLHAGSCRESEAQSGETGKNGDTSLDFELAGRSTTGYRVRLANIHLPLTAAPHSSYYISSFAGCDQFQVLACYVPRNIVRYVADVVLRKHAIVLGNRHRKLDLGLL